MGLLGRTNREFPAVWLSLATPSFTPHDWARELVAAAVSANTVIDISSNPGLWGGQMRGTEALLMAQSSTDIERAVSQEHAVELVQAHVIETLSAIGREYLDFYFLRVRDGLQEFQVNGALEALEAFRGPGHIRFLGLSCEGPPMATLGVWQWHDAFEVLLISDRSNTSYKTYDALEPLARERRVGIITAVESVQGHPTLKKVTTPDEIKEATRDASRV